MSSAPTDEFLKTAVKAARSAGEMILDNLGHLSKSDIGKKRAFDFVTRVDKESEKIIIDTIKEKHPGHTFLAEESLQETDAEDNRPARWHDQLYSRLSALLSVNCP
jgi:myo-inositol-1(or 4)-monophosphatase